MNSDEEQPPDDEVVIITGDGSSTTPDNRARSRSGQSLPGQRWGTGMRLGVVLAVIALFAFGVVVGRSTVTIRSGAAVRSGPPPSTTGPPTTAVPTTPAPSTSVPTTPVSPSSPPESSAQPTETWGWSDGDGLESAAWPTTVDSCGNPIPIPFIDSGMPLPDDIDMQLITGGSATEVNLADGSTGTSYFDPGDQHYLMDIATDSNGVVMAIGHCDDDDAPPHLQRVTPDGTETDIAVNGSYAGLISGGDRVWVATAPPGAVGSVITTLTAADSSGDTVTLAAGLIPLAGRGHTIICQQTEDNRPTWGVTVIDTATGDLTLGISQVPLIGASVAANAITTGEYMLTAPWACEDTCPLLLFQWSAGRTNEWNVDLDPPIDAILANPHAALSADGKHAAVTLYSQPPSPQPLDPAPPATRRPSGTQRIGLIDLATGTVTALPGVTLGPSQSPALTFSPDGAWLIAAIDLGTATRLVVYSADGDGPYDPHITLPGLTHGAILAPMRP